METDDQGLEQMEHEKRNSREVEGDLREGGVRNVISPRVTAFALNAWQPYSLKGRSQVFSESPPGHSEGVLKNPPSF